MKLTGKMDSEEALTFLYKGSFLYFNEDGTNYVVYLRLENSINSKTAAVIRKVRYNIDGTVHRSNETYHPIEKIGGLVFSNDMYRMAERARKPISSEEAVKRLVDGEVVLARRKRSETEFMAYMMYRGMLHYYHASRKSYQPSMHQTFMELNCKLEYAEGGIDDI